MAKLDTTPYFQPYDNADGAYSTFMFHRGNQMHDLDAQTRTHLQKDELVGVLLKWEVADGYANYVIVRTNPLTLQYVDDGCGYKAEPALIRGLNMTDVKAKVAMMKRWMLRVA